MTPLDIPPLPDPRKKRWRATDKAAIVHAIRAGRVTAEDAVERYNSSPEELASWAHTLDTYGVKALAVTSNKVRWYRGSGRRKQGPQ